MKMKNCDTLDYKIDCDNNISTVDNLFCKDVIKPNLKLICKEECQEGYIKQNGKCFECEGNR